MSNTGIGRARLFIDSLLLFGALIASGTAFMMSPHGETVAPIYDLVWLQASLLR